MNPILVLIMAGAVSAFISFGCGLSVVVMGAKLSSYMKKHKYERWCEISTISTPIGDIGPGARDSFKSLKYINSDADTDDIVIKKSKIFIRKSIKYFCILFIISMCFFALAILVIILSRR